MAMRHSIAVDGKAYTLQAVLSMALEGKVNFSTEAKADKYSGYAYFNPDESNWAIKELETEIYKYPITSEAHCDRKRVMRELMQVMGGKYDKHLICFPSVIGDPDGGSYDKEIGWMQSLNGICELSQDGTHGTFAAGFKEYTTFAEDKRFEFIPRFAAEYNLLYKQIIVASYITDGENIVLLHTRSNGETRIQDRYTMTQGHVEFDEKAYLMPQRQFLRKNAMMEFFEEIKVDPQLTIDFPTIPKYCVNTRVNHIDLEHIGLIYEIRVKSVKEIEQYLSTGESKKHSLVVLDLKNKDQYIDKMDVWLQYLVNVLR